MIYRILAESVVVLHFSFIAFVLIGALLCLKWPRCIVLHIPAAVWGALIMFRGWVCPLTPIENRFRRAAGETGYTESFIEHYIVPLVYPAQLTRGLQIGLGVGVIVVNVVIYGMIIMRRKKTARSP